MANRSYRILRIWIAAYHQFLRQVYRDHPHLIGAPYAEHRAFFLDGKYLYGDGFAQAMRRRGHAAEEIIANLIRLQGAWGRAHGLGEAPQAGPGVQPYLDRVLIAQVQAARPDVLYVQGISAFTPGLWSRVRAACPSLRLVIGFLGWRFDPAQAEGLDFLFLNVPGLAAAGELGTLPHAVLYHGFDETIPAEATAAAAAAGEEAPAAAHAFTFFGSSGRADPGYGDRFRYLVHLILRGGLEAWLHEPTFQNRRRDHAADAAQAAQWVADLGPAAAAERVIAHLGACPFEVRPTLADLFPDRCRDALYGLAMYRALARSRLTFNIHTDLAGGAVGNMRLFEATGMGTCLVTDHGANLARLFEPDAEVVTYRSVAECLEKVAYLLGHERERAAIAAAGRRRTLACHTVDHRVAEIDAVIQDRLRR